MNQKNSLTFFLFVLMAFTPEGSASVELFYTDLAVKYTLNKDKFLPVTEGSAIELFAAGNETVFFQVALGPFEREEPLKVRTGGISALKGPFQVKVYSIERCQSGFDADCLIPVSRGNGASSSRDIPSIFFVEVDVPGEANPGEYKGSVTFLWGESGLALIDFSLTVYPFTLPVRPSLTVDLNNYGVGFVKEAGYLPGSEGAYLLVKNYYRFLAAHKMVFNPLPYKSQRGTPHPWMAPVLEGRGESLRVRDWSGYDRYYAPIFDGSLFEDNVPIEHQYLPFNPGWPSDFSSFLNDRKRYEREWERVAAEFEAHFQKRGWSKTVFQVYMNQTPRPNNRIPWNLDEPKGVNDYRALRYYADLTHRVFSNRGVFKFRVDISHFYCDKHKGNFRKDFRVNGGEAILEPVDIWVISKHSLDCAAARKEATELKKRGREIYEYMSGHRMPLITEPLKKAVRYGWDAWLRGEDGILFWNTVKKRAGNSDGRNFLVYSWSEERKSGGPFASIRLKAIQRGAQDFEYFRIASKYLDVSPMVRDAVEGEPEKYREFRREVAAIITSNQGG